MERLTRKLKKGGYSANRHPAAQIDERLSQLKGVHKQWVGDVSDMITGMKQSEAAGQAGALTLAMLQASYAAIVRIGRRFEAVCPAEGNTDDAITALGKLEDLYEQCDHWRLRRCGGEDGRVRAVLRRGGRRRQALQLQRAPGLPGCHAVRRQEQQGVPLRLHRPRQLRQSL